MALLPSGDPTVASSLTHPATTAAAQKTNFTALRTFLSDLLGTDSGNKVAARAALGAAASGANTDITMLGNASSTIYTSSGTAIAYTITPTPAITAYATGQAFTVNFHLASGTTPTLQISGLASPVALLTQQSDGTYANVVGIPAGHRSEVLLLSATQAWVVMMPPASSSPQIISQPNPTPAASALTLPASTLSLAFRSATASDGVVPAAVTGTVAALTIPSGATLGTVSAVASSIIEVVMNNAGTLERAVVNLAGGNDLTETGFISTTAISAAATSASVFYSNTTRTNLPYRVVRRIDSTQATAGAWVTSPSLVQGVGGQALAAMSSLGYGQTWQSVTRTAGVTYYNTTGRLITLLVFSQASAGGIPTSTAVSINGGAVITFCGVGAASNGSGSGSIALPPGCSYVLTDTNIAARSSSELR